MTFFFLFNENCHDSIHRKSSIPQNPQVQGKKTKHTNHCSSNDPNVLFFCPGMADICKSRRQDSVPSLIHGKYGGQGTDIFPGDECGQQAKRSNVPLQYIPWKIKEEDQ